MSGVPLPVARDAAEELRALLAVGCERIEVAGSVRRQRPIVKDIELVAIPRFIEEDTGLWGDKERVDLLNARVAELLILKELAIRDVEVHRADGTVEHSHRMGDSYMALTFRGIPVDLFVVRPPAEWGVIFAIRTGPGDWNQRLVTDCQRYFRRVSGGQVLHLGQPVPCPEEADFFAALGQPWIEPPERQPSLVRISTPRIAA